MWCEGYGAISVGDGVNIWLQTNFSFCCAQFTSVASSPALPPATVCWAQAAMLEVLANQKTQTHSESSQKWGHFQKQIIPTPPCVCGVRWGETTAWAIQRLQASMIPPQLQVGQCQEAAPCTAGERAERTGGG